MSAGIKDIQLEYTPYRHINISQAQPAQCPFNAPSSQVHITLSTTSNPTLSQAITAEKSISSELWQILMEQLNTANEDNILLKTMVNKTVKQSNVGNGKSNSSHRQ